MSSSYRRFAGAPKMSMPSLHRLRAPALSSASEPNTTIIAARPALPGATTSLPTSSPAITVSPCSTRRRVWHQERLRATAVCLWRVRHLCACAILLDISPSFPQPPFREHSPHVAPGCPPEVLLYPSLSRMGLGGGHPRGPRRATGANARCGAAQLEMPQDVCERRLLGESGDDPERTASAQGTCGHSRNVW